MKKNWLMRGTAVLLSILMLVSLAACKSAETEEESQEPVKPESSAVEENEAEPTPTAEPTPVPEADPANTNILTGLPTLTDEAIGKRPVAVMINNVKAALPQDGVSAADVLFEIPVEADQTRLMGIFGDYTQIPTVCSIRSCRYYYPILALGFDAIYIHWGADKTIATDTLNRLQPDRFDGMVSGSGFGRDQDRLNSGYALEHTGTFYGEQLPEMAEKKNMRTDLTEDWMGNAFHFAAQGETVVPAGETVDFVKIEFGAQTSRFTYNAETHLYDKLHGTQPHIDAANGEQLAFTNVIVLETDISVRDDSGRKNVNWQGGENYTGYYLTEGAMQEITWSKADEYSKLMFFDADGNELTMNRGKTYIAVVYRDSVSFVSDL